MAMLESMNSRKKRVLLIAPKFYFYHIEILKSLKRSGFDVSFYPEMLYSLFYRFSKTLSNRIDVYLKDKYIKKILKSIETDNNYDVVLVIRGCSLTPKSMKSMHMILPNARFIMYQWDSMKQNNYKSIIKYFDKVFTFDMVDAKKYGLIYFPLFYTNHFKYIVHKAKKYDVVFYGSYHSDRLDVVKRFHKECHKKNLNFKSYLYITKLALLRLLVTRKIDIKDISFLHTHKSTLKDIIESYSRTRSVLDIELPIQDGLSIRSFETMGANLKLITTNKNIKNECFYDSKKIMVVDRDNIHIDIDFIKSNIIIDKEMKRFHIDLWLHRVLS